MLFQEVPLYLPSSAGRLVAGLEAASRATRSDEGAAAAKAADATQGGSSSSSEMESG